MTKNEEAIKEEWLKAYLSALQGAQAEAPPDDEEGMRREFEERGVHGCAGGRRGGDGG